MHNDLSKGYCRRCGTAIETVAGPPPVFRLLAECARCGYLTVLRDDPIDLPLHQSIAPYFEASQLDQIFQNDGDVGPWLQTVLAQCAARASEIFVADREVAVSGMMNLLNQTDDALARKFTHPEYAKLKNDGTSLNLTVIQMMYCLLAATGPVGLPSRRVSGHEVTQQVGSRAFPLLKTLAVNFKSLIPGVSQGLGRFERIGGDIRLHKSRDHALIVEASMNMLSEEQRNEQASPAANGDPKSIADAILPPKAREAVEIATGVKVATLASLFENKLQSLIDQGIAQRQGNLVMIIGARLPNNLRRLFEALSLTMDRVQRFSVPSFFGTGESREQNLPAHLAFTEVAAINWFAYYPCLEMRSPGLDHTIYLTSLRLWQGMLMNLPQRQSYLLQKLEDALSQGDAKSERLALFRQTRRDIHRALETDALKAMQRAGWQGAAGIEHAERKLLPCGEIDLLATARIGGNRVLFLGEVKDSDSPLFVPGALRRNERLVSAAEDQLDRKGRWVMDNWAAALSLLDVAEIPEYRDRILVRLVITRRPLGASFFQSFAGCALAGLAALARDLREKDHPVWDSPWRIHVEKVGV